jgi:hypothetical protein
VVGEKIGQCRCNCRHNNQIEAMAVVAVGGNSGHYCLMAAMDDGVLTVVAMDNSKVAARQGQQRQLWEMSSILQWAAADGRLVGCKEEVAATTAVAMLLHWRQKDWMVDSVTRDVGGGRADLFS